MPGYLTCSLLELARWWLKTSLLWNACGHAERVYMMFHGCIESAVYISALETPQGSTGRLIVHGGST